MAATEQASNPTNRKTTPNTMSASWPRSIARAWSSNRPPPKHRQDTRLDIDVDARPFALGTGRFGKKPTIPMPRQELRTIRPEHGLLWRNDFESDRFQRNK
jgi:hypothetical protein